MAGAPKWYDAHLDEFRKSADIKSVEEYRTLYRRSLDDPDGFWAEQAERYVTWEKRWDLVRQCDIERAEIKWFVGGVLNAGYNCLDRHLPDSENKPAYYWEGDHPDESAMFTYGELYKKVNKLAALLQRMGVRKGDRVVVYLPMIVELPVSLLACARIGAVHCVVYTGFSAAALADRLRDCGAKAVITADGLHHAGRIIELKTRVDETLETCPGVEAVIVHDHCGLNTRLDPSREVWWSDVVTDASLPDYVPPLPMAAEDPLFILYTSGSAGKPQGLVHTHGGYLVYAAMTTKLVFDPHENDVFWCAADVGWITGHTYGVYGLLANGLTGLLFEGAPTYPDSNRYWGIIDKYKVSIFYTTPTLIRSLANAYGETLGKHDLSSLRLLGSVGEPLAPDTWRWLYQHVCRKRAPIIDTWWQTETGGHAIAPLPAAAPVKPGSCSFPFFGVDPVIIDPETGDEVGFPNQEGALFIREPWPGMARTIYNNHERFFEIYFSQLPGMFFTGDGARKDEDGYYWITGRLDEVLNSSGWRLGAVELESVLLLHPKVAEAAVVGPPHPVKGQAIYAFVTLCEGGEKSEQLKKELIQLVHSEIGPFVAIDAIQWANALPKTRSGKILRRLLQKISSGQTDLKGDIAYISDPKIIQALIMERIGFEA